MRYKLLKELPDVKAGAIIEFGNYSFDGFQTWNNIYYIPNSQYTFSKKQLENSPDWFAPYMFTTEDGVDIFKGDAAYCVFENFQPVFQPRIFLNPIEGEKYFSTIEAAENYLKPLFYTEDYLNGDFPEQIKEEVDEHVCNSCHWTDYGTKSNCTQFNMCEGSSCESTLEKYNEDLDTNGEPIYNNTYCWFVFNKKDSPDIVYKTGKEIVELQKCFEGKTFSNKNNANKYYEELKESLKPEFKVGDIVVSETNIYGETFVGKLVDLTPVTLLSADDTETTFLKKEINRKATNSEIIKYYEQQGWVKGAKFKYYDKVYELDKISIQDKEVWINSNFTTIDKCELIKSPNYPKKWEDLDYNDQKANSEVLSAQELASLRLKDLHRVLIKEYNKNNNCDWKPDWSNTNKEKFVIIRFVNELKIINNYYVFQHLAFPNQDLAEFALENWKDLWEYYYELKQ